LKLESISTSQLSRKLGDVPRSFFEATFDKIVKKVMVEIGVKKGSRGMDNIHLIDASTVSMCLTHYRWAEFRSTKSGIKMNTRVVFCEGQVVPDKMVLTPAKPADKTQMDHLVVPDPDALKVFDRGYVDYRKFDEYAGNGIRFVTRLKANAKMEVLEEKTTNPESPIHREAIVRLGDDNTYKMEKSVRLIETRDSQGKEITIMTNDFNLQVEEIGDLYCCRWQIEFFSNGSNNIST
jgi:hypothetical protein